LWVNKYSDRCVTVYVTGYEIDFFSQAQAKHMGYSLVAEKSLS